MCVLFCHTTFYKQTPTLSSSLTCKIKSGRCTCCRESAENKRGKCVQTSHLLVPSAAGPKLHSSHNNVCILLICYYLTLQITFSSLLKQCIPEAMNNLRSGCWMWRTKKSRKNMCELYWIQDVPRIKSDHTLPVHMVAHWTYLVSVVLVPGSGNNGCVIPFLGSHWWIKYRWDALVIISGWRRFRTDS